jgi:predicted hydrocarbon binding protein
VQTSPKGKPNAWDLRRLVGSVNQLRFNDNKGEVSFFGQKMIILRRDVIKVMRDGLERLVQDQSAPFLSYLASGIGIHEGSIFRDSITATGPEQRAALENLVHSAFEDTNLGLGKVKIHTVDFDKAKASISISNCFEAMENGQSDEPNCMFTSGFLAGLFAEVLDKTVQARETKCISQGKEACEFEILPADAEEEAIDAEAERRDVTVEQESQKPKTITDSTKQTTSPTPLSENKSLEKPASPAKDQPGQSPNTVTSQADMDKGVETATRIEKRKQGFWKKHFKQSN